MVPDCIIFVVSVVIAVTEGVCSKIIRNCFNILWRIYVLALSSLVLPLSIIIAIVSPIIIFFIFCFDEVLFWCRICKNGSVTLTTSAKRGYHYQSYILTLIKREQTKRKFKFVSVSKKLVSRLRIVFVSRQDYDIWSYRYRS